MDAFHEFEATATGLFCLADRTLDQDAAARFLREQCASLRAGLEKACDAAAVTRVLSVHDASHQAWVELISAVHDTRGDAAARTVANLYVFHGRLAGSLERGPHPGLSATVCAEVRALLDAHLGQLTDAAVTAACHRSHSRRSHSRTETVAWG